MLLQRSRVPVDDDEDISREQGSRDGLDFPRMAAVLPKAGHKGAEVLIIELPGGMKFALRQRACDVPALTVCEKVGGSI